MAEPRKPGQTPAGNAQARAIDLKAIGQGRRAFDTAPQTYDATERTVELVLSEGGAVERWYGVEQLSTDEAAVDINRLRTSGIPFLDSHAAYSMRTVIGRITDVWFAEGRILGRAKFAETEAGKMAEGMVSRGEMTGISIGYRVDAWEVRDAEGTVIDPSKQILDVDDGLTFTATRWELLEVSLVSVPADPAAMARSHEGAADQNLRATPMGKDATGITLTRGDTSVTYHYGADAPHERALPAEQKGPSHMANRTRSNAAGAPRTAAKPPLARAQRAAEAPKVDDDGNYVDEDGNYVDADGKKVDKPVKADRATPTVDDDGYYVDADGNYCDADGNQVEEPVKAERDAPKVDDDGYYVDEDGNYVDADGAPSEDPVKARDEDAESGDDGERNARVTRPGPAGSGRRDGRRNLTVAQAADMARIGEQARAQGVELNIAAYIERGVTPQALRKIAFDKLADKSRETQVRGTSGGHGGRIEVLRDERQGKRDAMELALVTRVLASGGREIIDYKPKSKAAQRWVEQHAARSHEFLGMGFVEIAAECLGHRGHIRTSRQAIEIIERAFQTTSDFPAIFQNVLNKSLLARYELAEPTYKEISVQRMFKDFRPHPQVRAGEFPMLQPVNQAGELAAGDTADSGENITLKPYGVVFPITRQMIVNDELGAIDQILGSSGDSVRLFENTTFFAMFNSNPVLLQDGKAVFHAGHKNLGAASAITVAAVGAGRAVLRAQTSLAGYLLNVPPRIILTGPNQETFADQLVATITPQLSSSVNPFSGKLKSVSDANITDNSWNLMADPNQLPCFVHGFLEGSDGPRVRTYEPFGTQGVQVSLEHDFACGAIDFRGAYKNAGALPA